MSDLDPLSWSIQTEKLGQGNTKNMCKRNSQSREAALMAAALAGMVRCSPFPIGPPARRSSVADDGFSAHQELAKVAIVRDTRLDPVRRVVADVEVLDRRVREQIVQ